VNNWAELRPAVAAVVVLAVLAGAYEAAVRGPLCLPPPQLAAALATPGLSAATQASEAADLDSARPAPAPME